MLVCFFFFQAEDGIRDAQESRGLGDVYKRQASTRATSRASGTITTAPRPPARLADTAAATSAHQVSPGSAVQTARTDRPAARPARNAGPSAYPVSYTHLRAHETPEHLVCRLLLE